MKRKKKKNRDETKEIANRHAYVFSLFVIITIIVICLFACVQRVHVQRIDDKGNRVFFFLLQISNYTK